MTALGAFRDDFYNAGAALTAAQYTATAQASGTLSANALAGAQENFILSSGATALTTDTAVNIIARIQSSVATAYAASLTGFGAGVNPAPGAPNLFNVTFVVIIENTNAGTLTITAGTGVTLVGTATILTANQRTWVVTITSPTTVTMQTVGAQATVA